MSIFLDPEWNNFAGGHDLSLFPSNEYSSPRLEIYIHTFTILSLNIEYPAYHIGHTNTMVNFEQQLGLTSIGGPPHSFSIKQKCTALPTLPQKTSI